MDTVFSKLTCSFSVDLHVHFHCRRSFDVSVHGCRLSCPDQPLELGTAVVHLQVLEANVAGEQVEVFRLVSLDVQDLDTPLLMGQADSILTSGLLVMLIIRTLLN